MSVEVAALLLGGGEPYLQQASLPCRLLKIEKKVFFSGLLHCKQTQVVGTCLEAKGYVELLQCVQLKEER